MVVLRVAGVQGDVARRDCQHILDQRAGKPDAAVITQDRTGLGQKLHPLRRKFDELILRVNPTSSCVKTG